MRKNKLKRVRPDPGDSIQAREIKIRMSMKCLDMKDFVFDLVWENRVGLVLPFPPVPGIFELRFGFGRTYFLK